MPRRGKQEDKILTFHWTRRKPKSEPETRLVSWPETDYCVLRVVLTSLWRCLYRGHEPPLQQIYGTLLLFRWWKLMWNFTKDHDAVLFDDVVNIRESGDMVLCHW